jgi:hypothetical protein
VFDLEQQIRQWRQAQAAALAGRAEVLDELESHLRDEVQRLVQTGQTPKHAWEAALRRLGEPRQLAAEFDKLPPRGRASWLPARVVLSAEVVLVIALACMLGLALRHGKIRPLLASHVFAVTAGYTATFAVGLLGAWSILTRAMSGWDARRAQALRSAARKLTIAGLVLTAVGVALGCWWARENLGRYWDWDPREIGALGVLAWYGLMVACLLVRPSAERIGMLLAVAGNVVVSLSWFGPALLPDPHSYGGPSPWMLGFLIAFVVAQLLILGVALVPPGRWAWRRG